MFDVVIFKGNHITECYQSKQTLQLVKILGQTCIGHEAEWKLMISSLSAIHQLQHNHALPLALTFLEPLLSHTSFILQSMQKNYSN